MLIDNILNALNEDGFTGAKIEVLAHSNLGTKRLLTYVWNKESQRYSYTGAKFLSQEEMFYD